MLNGNEFFRFHIIVPRNAPLHDGYDTYDRFSDLISCVFFYFTLTKIPRAFK